jgi:hypothetical protein
MPQRYRKVKVNGKTRQLSRHLMEQHLGRRLDRAELVHHKNHDKLDDRIDNYELTNAQAHSQHHNQKHPITKPCVICGRAFAPQPTKRASKVTCSPECHRARRAQATAAQMAAAPPVFAKLTHELADQIRERYAAGGISQRALGLEFGVHHSQVGAIVRGEAWVRKAADKDSEPVSLQECLIQ